MAFYFCYFRLFSFYTFFQLRLAKNTQGNGLLLHRKPKRNFLQHLFFFLIINPALTFESQIFITFRYQNSSLRQDIFQIFSLMNNTKTYYSFFAFAKRKRQREAVLRLILTQAREKLT